jgi:hypothetical protein
VSDDYVYVHRNADADVILKHYACLLIAVMLLSHRFTKLFFYCFGLSP